MTNGFGMIIDGLVAILLVLTIGYCMMLNRRLKLLKADEQSLRATISELVTATEIAERAIGGLKLTVHECDTRLGRAAAQGRPRHHRDRPQRRRRQGFAGSAVADRHRRPRQRSCGSAVREALAGAAVAPRSKPLRRRQPRTTPKPSPPRRKRSPSGCA